MTADIESLLAKVKLLIQSVSERTLFSLGCRGYYENPASDLLAFFLSPDGEHGFKGTFLQAFFHCMKLDSSGIGFADVKVQREVQTTEGKLLDLVVQGSGWALLIENKIFHAQVNPFESYAKLGRTLVGDAGRLEMAILSPSGKSARDNWVGVSYREYCAELRRRLSEFAFDAGYSKWIVFAREFIVHLETELYQPTNIMTEEEASFVEENEGAINRVKKLSFDYRAFLLALLRDRLNSSITGQEFTTKDDGWAVRCTSSNWGRSNIAFWTTKPEQREKRFQLKVYLIDLTPEQESAARCAFDGMKLWSEGAWTGWQAQPGFDTRAEAVDALCGLAKKVSELFPTVPLATSSPGPAVE